MDTSIVSMLADNSDTVMNDAKDILVKLLGNVLNDPNNTKYRAVKLTNKTIEEKLLPPAHHPRSGVGSMAPLRHD